VLRLQYFACKSRVFSILQLQQTAARAQGQLNQYFANRTVKTTQGLGVTATYLLSGLCLQNIESKSLIGDLPVSR